MLNLSKYNLFFITFFIIQGILCNPISEQEKTSIPSKKEIIEDKSLTSLGKIFAGILEPNSEKENKILQTEIYKNHHKQMTISWKKTEEIRLQKMREWVKQELNFTCEKKNTIFYPFSGPDFLNIQILFPCGDNYILFGLEPPGKLREFEKLNQKEMQNYFSYIQSSLYSILNYSFFRTNDMKIDFFKKLDGIAPILLTFLAYNQNKIIRITDVTLTNENSIIENKSDFGIPGIRIYFIDSIDQSKIKKVTYFQIDISNENIKNNIFFLENQKKESPFFTFIKAASYLMHNESFSIIRDFILSNSEIILQDDSGIPLKFFEQKKWDLIFYGMYVEPIPLFKRKFQQDLRKIYLNKNNIKPLPFGTGYNFYPGTSNLMLAIKKNHS